MPRATCAPGSSPPPRATAASTECARAAPSPTGTWRSPTSWWRDSAMPWAGSVAAPSKRPRARKTAYPAERRAERGRAARDGVRSGPRLEYEARVNRVVDYIREHLAEELSLAGLARVAAFSPYHFHRVFRAISGETLFSFIHRQRIEKAAGALLSHADESVLAVALDHGFASAASFARAFKTHFDMSATEWRGGGAHRWQARQRRDSNPGKQLRKPRKASPRARPQSGSRERPMSIRVSELPPRHVAYMRYVGPYGAQGIPDLWIKFNKWLEGRGLLTDTRLTLGVGYDDPRITAGEKCRYDACVVVPQNFVPDRWVTAMDVAGGRYAVAEFVGTAHEIEDAWGRVFAAWLPQSAWQPDDRPCFEAYQGNPMVDARAGVFRCQLCLPLRPL